MINTSANPDAVPSTHPTGEPGLAGALSTCSARTGSGASTTNAIVNGGRRQPLVLAISLALAAPLLLGLAHEAQAFPATVQLSSLNGSTGFRLDGVAESDRSGVSVSAAGDVNGDGIDDLIIGAEGTHTYDGPSYTSGSSYVVFGSGSGFASSISLGTLDGNSGFRLDGTGRSGRSVSDAGDVTGDGIDDLIIGTDGDNAGTSYVVFGQEDSGQGDVIFKDSFE